MESAISTHPGRIIRIGGKILTKAYFRQIPLGVFVCDGDGYIPALTAVYGWVKDKHDRWILYHDGFNLYKCRLYENSETEEQIRGFALLELEMTSDPIKHTEIKNRANRRINALPRIRLIISDLMPLSRQIFIGA